MSIYLLLIYISFGSNVRIVLTKNHELTSRLGVEGDTVVVKAGFMRNCLLKKGLAVYAVPYHRERIINRMKINENDEDENNDNSNDNNNNNNVA